MTPADVYIDFFERILENGVAAVDGLTDEQLAHRIQPDANSIAWLVWHLTRVQDDHVADVAGVEQVWTAQGWNRKFALPLDDADIGYGHTSEQVGQVTVAEVDLLLGYHDAVHRASVDYVRGLADEDFGRVVDERWDPPVTLAIRLVSVVSDDLQHAGQAAFVRGLLKG